MLTQVLWALLCAMLTILLHCAYAYRLILVLRQHSKSLHGRQAKENALQLYIFVEAVLMLLLLLLVPIFLWLLNPNLPLPPKELDLVFYNRE